MTPADFAAYAANGIADGGLSRLPRLTPDATPDFARDMLRAYYLLLDRVDAVRRKEGQTMELRDRIALASVRSEISAAIGDARLWLSRVARRGGRGVPL